VNRCQGVFRALQARARNMAAKSGGSAPTGPLIRPPDCDQSMK